MTATLTKYVAANTECLRKFEKGDMRLRELLDLSGHTFNECKSRRSVLTALAPAVGELRDALAIHFALEEMHGYHEMAIDAAPQLAEQSKAFRDEHVTLYLEICQIAERLEKVVYSESPATVIRQLRKRYQAFQDQLLTHEAHEIDVICGAAWQDIGVCD